MVYDLVDILKHFNINQKIEPYGNGHINDTFICNSHPRYILQKLNTEIFESPYDVMENIQAVTEHLRKKITEAGGDPDRETLQIINTVDGNNLYKTPQGDYFRVYIYVENSVTKEKAEKPEDLYNAAKAFGRFQNLLADFPADSLHETIVNFHNTPVRFETFKKSVQDDLAHRADKVRTEIEFALARETEVGQVVKLLESGELPIRVTHNDTKLNNVLFDAETDNAMCVIDLDTVMPGSLLYDYGDALRFGASSSDEDERDLDKVYFDLDKFRAFTKGFLEEMRPSITEKEIELLPFSVKLLTFECGIRFLGDYLNGDTYFKIHRPDHNLDRARTQLKLVKDIEDKTEEMKKIVAELL